MKVVVLNTFSPLPMRLCIFCGIEVIVTEKRTIYAYYKSVFDLRFLHFLNLKTYNNVLGGANKANVP